ncbi:MAG: DUF1190 domain-containing protein [Methylocystis sp.]|uniref:DUF1190 domain-containing protein n=1 Tax=Methylocystis sp. TaxID=1911079 RepID=UPI00393BA11D
MSCPGRGAGIRLSPIVSLAGLLSFFNVGAAPAATAGKAYFFASRDACIASQTFSARDCAGAFANAREQLLDLAPRFSSGGECRLRFQLCEILGGGPQEDEALAYAEAEVPTIYTPVALGVEMVATANGVEAAPTLAVDTPAKLFPQFPVSEIYERREDVDRYAAILPAGRFHPFPKRKPLDVNQVFRPFALGAIEKTRRSASQETPEARRERLKNAPFVE